MFVRLGNSGSTTKITTSTDTAPTVTLESNTEYRYSEVTALSLSLPDTIADDYAAWLVFTSGDTATEIDYPDSIKWSGDGVADGIFEPSENKTYNIGLWYDGTNINAVVRGVEA